MRSWPGFLVVRIVAPKLGERLGRLRGALPETDTRSTP
jgi:hypothetical protein